MRKIPFVKYKYYHVFNRGVDKREIFYDNNDYYRFISHLIVFNDASKRLNVGRNLKLLVENADKRNPIVEILAYCLMPNHYHLLLRQLTDDGISVFLQKLGGGYTCFYNTRHQRNGVLFQGSAKNVLVETNEQLLHLSRYIHLNPTDLFRADEGFDFIENYPWSSCRFFTKHLSSKIISGESIIKEQFQSPLEYRSFLMDLNRNLDNAYIADLAIDAKD